VLVVGDDERDVVGCKFDGKVMRGHLQKSISIMPFC
jgi:hypothetical protein